MLGALALFVVVGAIAVPVPAAYPQSDSAEPGDIPLFQAASGTATPGTGGRAPTLAPVSPPAGPAGSDGAPLSAPLTRTATPTAAATATLGPPRATPTLRPGARPESDDRGPRYAGWATEAYPQDSAEKMEQMMTRQRANGANVVWIGHNNPGEVDAAKAEPGLSYAVYEALQNPHDPRNADAQAILAAVERLLRAARGQGLKVVLPLGYQSQMGTTWDEAHPDALRRGSRGGVSRETTVVNASFFAPDYRRDIRRYYEWADERLVRPYRDALLMLNLADEPSGGDYSAWAEGEFIARFGYGFSDVGEDATRLMQLGGFQSGYIAEYAAWSAEQWAELEPTIPTTMSFEGATARLHFQLPVVEAVFARTPPTFYPTFDAYPRDGPPDMPLEDAELVRLFGLVRSLGHFSARYARPFWLWSTANSWGLAQASPQPANVADAVANGYYLALLARQSGGMLQGIAVWNYNVNGQGLYNNPERTTYEPDTMFARVSESLPRLRQIMAARAGATRVLIVAPNGFPYRLLGTSRSVDPFAFRSYEFHRLAAFARNNVPAAVVSELAGEDLSRISTIVLLARYPQDLASDDEQRLRDYLNRGGMVIAPRHLSSVLGPKAEYIDGDRAEEAFADPAPPERMALWRRAFGVERPLSGGFLVATEQDAVLYNIGTLFQAEVWLPFPGQGWLADPSGFLVQRLTADGGRVALSLGKNNYAYLTR